MNEWDKFKKKSAPKAEGREVMGTYRCQFCSECVFKATYYPVDQVLKYVCVNDHTNFLEDFKLAF